MINLCTAAQRRRRRSNRVIEPRKFPSLAFGAVSVSGLAMQNRRNSGNVQGEEAYAGAKDAAGCGTVHVQVRRIQMEEEQAKDPSPRQVLEPRPVFRDLTRQLSRSPLGWRVGHPISVGK